MALNVYCKIIVIIALLTCMYHQKLSECVCGGGGGGGGRGGLILGNIFPEIKFNYYHIFVSYTKSTKDDFFYSAYLLL